ncbi:MAG TPA: hypothetical protein VEU97_09740 [Ktedonobacteraceae bacterium]|nr:hypothetical protein [Ktedonobacteraceae bacterium]
MIEQAYEQAEAVGIMQLNEDETGPYQAIPQPGASWQPEDHLALQPYEYERGGTAKLLTLFRPATGILNAKGVLSAPNVILHLPPLRIILVLDNLAGHLSCDLVFWFFEHGVMPLYTPIGDSWLNMAESVQRIIVPRALAGQHPQNAQQVIDWLEQAVVVWNQAPPPLCGMASGDGEESVPPYAVWLVQERCWSKATQLTSDPLVQSPPDCW